MTTNNLYLCIPTQISAKVGDENVLLPQRDMYQRIKAASQISRTMVSPDLTPAA